jgi:hypothetical protein
MSTPAASVSPTLADGYAAICAFIAAVTGLVVGVSVVQGLENRSSEPLPGFINVEFLYQHRLRTNIDSFDTSGGPPTTASVEAEFEYTFQIDCYGPNGNSWATMLCTLLRDEYATSQLSPQGVTPLYADDARLIQFVNAEAQYEQKWAVDARFQINPVTTVPQQFADALSLEFVSAEQRYPPA